MIIIGLDGTDDYNDSIVMPELPVIDPNIELFSLNMLYNVLSHVDVGE